MSRRIVDRRDVAHAHMSLLSRVALSAVTLLACVGLFVWFWVLVAAVWLGLYKPAPDRGPASAPK